jgi:hypothetical protein
MVFCKIILRLSMQQFEYGTIDEETSKKGFGI